MPLPTDEELLTRYKDVATENVSELRGYLNSMDCCGWREHVGINRLETSGAGFMLKLADEADDDGDSFANVLFTHATYSKDSYKQRDGQQVSNRIATLIDLIKEHRLGDYVIIAPKVNPNTDNWLSSIIFQPYEHFYEGITRDTRAKLEAMYRIEFLRRRHSRQYGV